MVQTWHQFVAVEQRHDGQVDRVQRHPPRDRRAHGDQVGAAVVVDHALGPARGARGCSLSARLFPFIHGHDPAKLRVALGQRWSRGEVRPERWSPPPPGHLHDQRQGLVASTRTGGFLHTTPRNTGFIDHTNLFGPPCRRWTDRVESSRMLIASAPRRRPARPKVRLRPQGVGDGHTVAKPTSPGAHAAPRQRAEAERVARVTARIGRANTPSISACIRKDRRRGQVAERRQRPWFAGVSPPRPSVIPPMYEPESPAGIRPKTLHAQGKERRPDAWNRALSPADNAAMPTGRRQGEEQHGHQNGPPKVKHRGIAPGGAPGDNSAPTRVRTASPCDRVQNSRCMRASPGRRGHRALLSRRRGAHCGTARWPRRLAQPGPRPICRVA